MFDLLRDLYENKNIIQNYKKEEILELIKNSMLVYENNAYHLSDKGQKYLDEFKVDNAIIMAAGFGSRFIPFSYTSPKGLLNVNGEALVERQIRQLKDVGIEEIIVVVGHLKEKFQYLKDKYDVCLVENKDYFRMNNISTLFHAAQYLKRSYILTSDIYMPNNLYHKYEKDSWYACRYFSGETDEWGVSLDQNNNIIEVNKHGYNQWAMYGPAFFDFSFSKKILDDIKELYDIPAAQQFYWEDVYRNNFHSYKMKALKLGMEAIYEFESVEELRVFDKSYLENGKNPILDYIAAVFSVDQSKIKELLPLKADEFYNRFEFKINNKTYIFKSLINPSFNVKDEELKEYQFISRDYNSGYEILEK